MEENKLLNALVKHLELNQITYKCESKLEPNYDITKKLNDLMKITFTKFSQVSTINTPQRFSHLFSIFTLIDNEFVTLETNEQIQFIENFIYNVLKKIHLKEFPLYLNRSVSKNIKDSTNFSLKLQLFLSYFLKRDMIIIDSKNKHNTIQNNTSLSNAILIFNNDNHYYPILLNSNETTSFTTHLLKNNKFNTYYVYKLKTYFTTEKNTTIETKPTNDLNEPTNDLNEPTNDTTIEKITETKPTNDTTIEKITETKPT
jgi:hypothetical protein